MQLKNLFPVCIGESVNPSHNIIEKQLINECINLKNNINKGGDNWESNVFNSCGSYNLTNNEKFNDLNKWIFDKVIKYAFNIGYKNNNIKCTSSWFNIYNKHDYQEIHEHYPNDISAVYYLKSLENSGSIVFYTHEPKSTKDSFNIDNEYTWGKYIMNPKSGTLLVFKSNLKHGVQQIKTDNQKISLAYNFKVE